MVGPPSKLNDWSTTEDDPCEPETEEVGYPETEDILSVSRYHWSDLMCRQPNGIAFSIEAMLSKLHELPWR